MTRLQSDTIGGSTWLLIVSSSSHVHEKAYSLFDSIPKTASFSFGHNIVPIHSSHNLSGVNPPLPAPRENWGINHSSEGPGIGSAWVIARPLQLSQASCTLPSNKGTGFTFWATHLYWARTLGALVFSSKLHFAESRYKEKGCFWLRSGAMPLLIPTQMPWILSWLPCFPSPEPLIPSTMLLLPSSYPTLQLPVLPPVSTHTPNPHLLP